MQGAVFSEWKRGWRLVLASVCGVALSSANIYSIGLFIQPLQQEFGWSRAQITSNLTIVAIFAVLGSPGVGMLLDKWGTRRFALPGAVFLCLAMASLSLAATPIWTWWALSVLLALPTVAVQPMVWASAVSSLFSKGRGLALAITLAGTGLASFSFPFFTYTLIRELGWRNAYVAFAAILGAIAIPVVWRWFFDARDGVNRSPGAEKLAPVVLTGWTLKRGVRQRQFWQLLISTFLTTMIVVGFIVHLVSMLGEVGIDRNAAAKLAGIVGITSIAGRLTVGYLLDHLPGPLIGMVSVALPIVAAAILLAYPQSNTAAMIAVAFVGLAVGGELDVITYLSTRYFGLKNFGSLFGMVVSALHIGVGLGPLLAGLIFDLSGSYRMFLVAVIPLSALSALMLATLGKYPKHEIAEGLQSSGSRAPRA